MVDRIERIEHRLDQSPTVADLNAAARSADQAPTSALGSPRPAASSPAKQAVGDAPPRRVRTDPSSDEPADPRTETALRDGVAQSDRTGQIDSGQMETGQRETGQRE